MPKSLRADLEGVKLDIVIMQNDIESKIHAANRNNIRVKDEITQLKHELFCEKEKCRLLENDLSILVLGNVCFLLYAWTLFYHRSRRFLKSISCLRTSP
jgi:hypothetical protein